MDPVLALQYRCFAMDCGNAWCLVSPHLVLKNLQSLLSSHIHTQSVPLSELSKVNFRSVSQSVIFFLSQSYLFM